MTSIALSWCLAIVLVIAVLTLGIRRSGCDLVDYPTSGGTIAYEEVCR